MIDGENMFERMYIAFLFLCSISYVLCVSIDDNAYKGISISFSNQIKEQHFDFDKLKKVMQKSSEYLYHATRKQAYFEEFIIVVPSTWTMDFCTDTTIDSPEKMTIYITNAVENLRAQHSAGCGKEGDIIYMSLPWMTGNTEDLARDFVRQWSVYRYGVFEETALENDVCFISSKNLFSPVGCYDAQISVQPDYDDYGLPLCKSPKELLPENLKSSLMFKSNFSKATDFCDGSSEFPHNPIMPTLHNNICEGRTVWSVIESSPDFNHGKNPASSILTPPASKFKCFQEPALQLTLAIQNSATSDVTLVVDELRFALYHFIRNLLPKQAAIKLMTFSDEANVGEPVDLDLYDEKKLYETLNKYVVTTVKVSSTCLLCGITKVLNNTKFPSTVMITAFESSLAGVRTSSLIEALQMAPKVKVHLILLKDTIADIIPTNLVKAIQDTGGYLHLLPNPERTTTDKIVANVQAYNQFNIALSAAAKRPLQIDDNILVVHSATFKDISQISDTFTVPNVNEGKLIYFMHCDLKGQIIGQGPNCSLWDAMSSTYKCGSVIDLKEQQGTEWTYKFNIRLGVNNPICTSTALLFETVVGPIHLRGWLSEYEITPGKNYLIIYAELMGISSKQEIEVFAYISGPQSNFFKLQLRDNGNGDPDVKADDGIYSRYFTSYKEKGTYVVTVIAKNMNSLRSITSGKDSAEIIQRKIIGSFSVTDKPIDIDIIPPNRVTDLKVLAIDHENSAVTLQWTAPGDDLDFGKATDYEVFFTTDWKDLQETMLTKLSLKTLHLPSKLDPKQAGENETLTFQLAELSETIHYFAIRAIDAFQNKGALSNAVQVFVPSKYSNTSDDANVTESTTESSELGTDSSTSSQWYIKIGGLFGGLLLLILIVNCVVWLLCFRKHRKRNKNPSTTNDKSPIGYSETDFVEDTSYQAPQTVNHSYVNTEEDYCISIDGQKELVQTPPSNPSVLYSRVHKQSSNRGNNATSERENVYSKSRHGNHIEKDLGLV